jgi:RNA polymerase sigma-70 factor (family 1)
VISRVSVHEKEWVKGLLESREASFRTIYDAYQRNIFSFAFYLSKSKDISEEVVQEVFIRLWENRGNLTPDTHLMAFLKKVTQNLVLDIFRKANADKNLQERLYNHMTAAATHHTPDKVLEKELATIYIQALNKLPPQQRLIFAMRNDQNLSYRQIADQLGLSRNTVRNHIHIATHSIRHYVEQNADLGFVIMALIFRRGS